MPRVGAVHLGPDDQHDRLQPQHLDLRQPHVADKDQFGPLVDPLRVERGRLRCAEHLPQLRVLFGRLGAHGLLEGDPRIRGGDDGFGALVLFGGHPSYVIRMLSRRRAPKRSAAHLSRAVPRRTATLQAPPPARPRRHVWRCAGFHQALRAGLAGTPEMHQTGRGQLVEGFKIALGDDYQPTLEELQILGAIADLESNYGRGWSGPMQGSNNWGAITCPGYDPDTGTCPAGCSPNKDSSPYSGEYVTCFRRWASPADGAAGLISFIYKWPEVQAAIKSGNIDEVSWTMRQRSYFLGFKTDPREAARDHAGALDKRVGEIVSAMGEEQKAWRKGEDWQPGDDAGSPGGAQGGASSTDLVAYTAAAGGLFYLWRTGALQPIFRSILRYLGRVW